MLNYRLSIDLIWRHRQSRFSMSHFRATFPHQIQAHSLHICNPFYSHGPAINPVYHQKAIKLTSCQANNTLRQKLRATVNLQGPYLTITSDVNLSPTQHPTSKYCSSVILPSGLELGCLRWEGAALIRYRINMSCYQTTTKKT